MHINQQTLGGAIIVLMVTGTTPTQAATVFSGVGDAAAMAFEEMKVAIATTD